MKMRDREYIGDRLLGGAGDNALDAYQRLLVRGEFKYAEELMDAMQQFTDKCRDIRRRMLQDEVS